MCYLGSIMKHGEARAGQTEKVSVSIDRGDLVLLRKRARRLHRGNLSAVIAEGVRRVREEEGRDALVRWLGDAGDAPEPERAAMRDEWRTPPPSRRRPAK